MTKATAAARKDQSSDLDPVEGSQGAHGLSPAQSGERADSGKTDTPPQLEAAVNTLEAVENDGDAERSGRPDRVSNNLHPTHQKASVRNTASGEDPSSADSSVLPRDASGHRQSSTGDWKERLLAKARALLESVEKSADGSLVVQASTPLPTAHGTFDLRLFEFKGQEQEHLAISVGDLSGDVPVLARLHSECLTGEILSSLKCDCGDQLDYALKAIAKEGRGIVLYLRQEGRGIGLANKLRAYALQALGADTVDANRLLGLPDDARQYDAAAAALRHLGVQSVRLLTNNPTKVRALEQLGIPVAERVPVVVPTNPIAVEYLRTKRDRMEHQLSDADLDESA